jgi:predicted RNase H-like HicB family nuclease
VSDYHINIFYSEEDRGYIADIPDLEFCSAFGSTPAEALQELQHAREAWVEAARAEGRPIPEPRYRPIIYQTPAAA